MSAPLTPEQEAQVRAIAAEMIGQALRGADMRLRAQPTAEQVAGRQKIIDGARSLVRALDEIAIAEGRAPRCEVQPVPQECGGAPHEDGPSAASPPAPKGVH